VKRVIQTKFGKPHGNCFEACLASILELPLDEVPCFKQPDWLEQINRWLRWHFSLQLIMMPSDEGFGPGVMSPNTYVIASGPNHRGVMHSVVHRGITMVHDPNPNNGGLREVSDLLVFVAVNPARMMRRKKSGTASCPSWFQDRGVPAGVG
jgi:hypothetical protein